ncbi:TetR/AcrR family transcriptional regulator [Consotaella salsifontis]|nr:TetR/AcrR family transcriptional regulator [Consotaella salsifontis]
MAKTATIARPSPALSKPREGRRGRPKKGTAGLVTEQIVAVATELFFERGLAATNMDDVAARAHSSKRTLYARFPSKEALFETVIISFIRERLQFVQSVKSADETPTQTLLSLGERFLEQVLTPETVSLYRLLVCESDKFPNLPRILEEEGWEPTIRLIAEVLRQDSVLRGVDDDEIRFLAETFLALTAESPLRRASLGLQPPKMTDQIRKDLRRAILIFRNGYISQRSVS